MKSATSLIRTPGLSLPSDFASSSQEARRSENCMNPSTIRPLIAGDWPESSTRLLKKKHPPSNTSPQQ